MKRTRKSVTIHDVARNAGVSVSTVSRVLNDKDDVAADTSERVRRVIDELGYASSLAARGLRSRKTNVIGLILPDVASPYCIEILQGVNRAIVQLEYDLIIYTNGDIQRYATTEQERNYVTLLNGGIADGVIVVTPTANKFSTDGPVVAINPNNANLDCPSIIPTNKHGAISAVNYLTDLGHRRIGFITGHLNQVSANLRLQGYKDGLAAVGIPVDQDLIRVGDYTTETAVICTQELLALENPPTAIFASNDLSAMGVYRVVKEADLQIPGDISVIGFDNLQVTASLKPPLTTVDQFISEMGSLAIDMVVKLINGDELERKHINFKTQLVVRNSCRSLV